MFVWVYQYEAPENGKPVTHASYRTPEAIEKRGGVLIRRSGKQVPAYEIDSSGMWRPDRNPVT